MDAQHKTLWVGNLPDKISEELLYELFLQAGPLERVHVPKEKRYGFIQFKHEASVPYSVRIMDGISIFGNLLNMRARTGSVHDNPGPAHRTPYIQTDMRRGGGENNSQNRGSSPYDNSKKSRNYEQRPNANTSGGGGGGGHYVGGNNSRDYSSNRPEQQQQQQQQTWQKGMPHQALPNMQPPTTWHRNHRRPQHEGGQQSSRSSHSAGGDYKGGSSYRHEPYRRY